MANYNWQPSMLRRVFILPEDVASRQLRLAGAVQLKVLLWVAAHGGEYDGAACAKAVGESEAICRDALQYWVQNGTLSEDGTEPTAAVVIDTVPAQTAVKPISVPAARPAAVKPTVEDVLRRQEESPEYAYLLQAVSARLGRTLSHGDMETLLYLLDTAGVPAEVLLMVVGYAVQMEKLNLRYIEKVALDWADRGILTMAAAEEYLCRLERMDEAAAKVTELCGLEKQPTGYAAREHMVCWIYDWQLPDELIREAADRCTKKRGTFQVSYVDKILTAWHDQGFTAVNQVTERELSPAAAPSSTAPSEYDDIVQSYLPVYRKKKGTR